MGALKFLLVTSLWMKMDESDGEVDREIIVLCTMLVLSLIVSVLAKTMLVARQIV